MKKFAGVVMVVAMLALSACAGGLGLADTPQQKVFAATTAYDAALTVAITYKKLPVCKAGVQTAPCSDPAVVATIQKADNVAAEALKSAQTVVRSTNATESGLNTAVRWAQEAINAFSRVTAALNVK